MVFRGSAGACAVTLNMPFLRCLVFIWIFCALTLDLDAFSCPKGQRVVVSKQKKRCDPCPEGYFQPEENTSKQCKPCRKCDGSRGSVAEENCTLERNRKCKCQENFVPLESDSTTCKCDEGYSQQFEKCIKREEKIPAKATTSNKISNLITSLTSPRPRERATTQEPPQNITTTTGQLGLTATPNEKPQDSHTSDIVLGLIFVMLGLLSLTVLTCKKNLLPCMQRKPEQTKDSSYRTPVEESGDGSQDSLKQNSEEP